MPSNKDWDQFNKKTIMMLADIKYNPSRVDKYLKEMEILTSKEEVEAILKKMEEH